MRELRQQAGQLLILGLDGTELAPRLRALDPNTLTPLEALNLLHELKKQLD